MFDEYMFRHEERPFIIPINVLRMINVKKWITERHVTFLEAFLSNVTLSVKQLQDIFPELEEYEITSTCADLTRCGWISLHSPGNVKQRKYEVHHSLDKDALSELIKSLKVILTLPHFTIQDYFFAKHQSLLERARNRRKVARSSVGKTLALQIYFPFLNRDRANRRLKKSTRLDVNLIESLVLYPVPMIKEISFTSAMLMLFIDDYRLMQVALLSFLAWYSSDVYQVDLLREFLFSQRKMTEILGHLGRNGLLKIYRSRRTGYVRIRYEKEHVKKYLGWTREYLAKMVTPRDEDLPSQEENSGETIDDEDLLELERMVSNIKNPETKKREKNIPQHEREWKRRIQEAKQENLQRLKEIQEKRKGRENSPHEGV